MKRRNPDDWFNGLTGSGRNGVVATSYGIYDNAAEYGHRSVQPAQSADAYYPVPTPPQATRAPELHREPSVISLDDTPPVSPIPHPSSARAQSLHTEPSVIILDTTPPRPRPAVKPIRQEPSLVLLDSPPPGAKKRTSKKLRKSPTVEFVDGPPATKRVRKSPTVEFVDGPPATKRPRKAREPIASQATPFVPPITQPPTAGPSSYVTPAPVPSSFTKPAPGPSQPSQASRKLAPFPLPSPIHTIESSKGTSVEPLPPTQSQKPSRAAPMPSPSLTSVRTAYPPPAPPPSAAPVPARKQTGKGKGKATPERPVPASIPPPLPMSAPVNTPTSARSSVQAPPPTPMPAPKVAGKGTGKDTAPTQARTPRQPKPVVEKRMAMMKKRCPKATQERLERVALQRFFMIDRKRVDREGELREEFQVLGSTGNVYTVTVQKVPSCNCPDAMKGNHCKHILFVFAKVLQVPFESHVWYQKALLSTELEEIFASAPMAPNDVSHPRVLEAYARVTGKTPAGAAGDDGKRRRKIEKGTECPICYEDMFGVQDSLLAFCDTCGNALHNECFGQWAKSKGRNVTCPFCRAKWPVAPPATPGPSRPRGQDGYLNLANAAGMSPVRDTSTYYHGPRRGERHTGHRLYDERY
ncbi:hypothetical protein BDW22DRAFT_1362000 [Trametopsis cervina]|nr:hypothetical protein BDW22DRAFT_1362000 [Trametopsis cervina]